MGEIAGTALQVVPAFQPPVVPNLYCSTGPRFSPKVAVRQKLADDCCAGRSARFLAIKTIGSLIKHPTLPMQIGLNETLPVTLGFTGNALISLRASPGYQGGLPKVRLQSPNSRHSVFRP